MNSIYYTYYRDCVKSAEKTSCTPTDEIGNGVYRINAKYSEKNLTDTLTVEATDCNKNQ
jgi:hypothetical protein